MKTTVAHRRDTVAMILGTATVASPLATRTYVATVAHRCGLPHLRTRACAHAHARTREMKLRTMGTVATVCDGAPVLRGAIPVVVDPTASLPWKPARRPTVPHVWPQDAFSRPDPAHNAIPPYARHVANVVIVPLPWGNALDLAYLTRRKLHAD